MCYTPLSLLFPVPLRTGMIVPIRVSTVGQIEIFNHLLYLKQLTVCKQEIKVELNNYYHIIKLEIF